MTFQGSVAQFVASATPSWSADVAWSRVRLALLDTIAVSIAAARHPALTAALRYVRASRGQTSEDTAFVAGVAAHALDYDDVTPAWRGHPSAVMLPALVAFAATRSETTGESLARAYGVGFEAGARLGKAIAGRHYERGWHSTSTVGVIAATAACARLAGFDATTTSHALGLAVAQAGGVQANFGTSAKAMHAGFAAGAAVRACALAECGVDASARALDGPHGFADLMVEGDVELAALDGIDTSTPALATAGIEVKLYPSCYATHRAIEAAFALRERYRIDVDAIDEVTIQGTPGAHTPLLNRLPETGTEARFSVEYAVACALVDGEVGFAAFERAPDAVQPHATIMRRSRVSETGSPASTRAATVRVRMRDGRVLEQSVSTLRGYRPEGIDEAWVLNKAGDCLRYAGVDESAERILAAIDAARDKPIARLFDGELMGRIRATLWR